MFINKEHTWLKQDDITIKKHSVPHWTDCCCHPEGSYIGSATYWTRIPNSGSKVCRIDVYVFDGVGWKGKGSSAQYVCIRVSDDPSGYASPGTLVDFLIAAQRHPTDHAYAAAALVIDHFMEIKATKRVS
jgi:hypothetical protein